MVAKDLLADNNGVEKRMRLTGRGVRSPRDIALGLTAAREEEARTRSVDNCIVIRVADCLQNFRS